MSAAPWVHRLLACKSLGGEGGMWSNASSASLVDYYRNSHNHNSLWMCVFLCGILVYSCVRACVYALTSY